MLININTAVYKKGILIMEKDEIIKLYFKGNFILGK